MSTSTRTKGEETREAVLDRALALASKVGLEGLTIGLLADDVGMSKSGLYAHFGSKEALEVAVLDEAARRFTADVVAPALTAPRGEPRIRELFRRWFTWGLESPLPGGCPMIAAGIELDDRPGAARDRLVALQRDWQETLATAARIAQQEGHFRADADPVQFGFEAYGIALSAHHFARLLRDPEAMRRSVVAFEALLDRMRVPGRAPMRDDRDKAKQVQRS
jgi:AcrR family transcriptional regulator